MAAAASAPTTAAAPSRVAPWEYPNGVPIALESRTIGCTRNTWIPDKTYNKATEKCEPGPKPSSWSVASYSYG